MFGIITKAIGLPKKSFILATAHKFEFTKNSKVLLYTNRLIEQE